MGGGDASRSHPGAGLPGRALGLAPGRYRPQLARVGALAPAWSGAAGCVDAWTTYPKHTAGGNRLTPFGNPATHNSSGRPGRLDGFGRQPGKRWRRTFGQKKGVRSWWVRRAAIPS